MGIGSISGYKSVYPKLTEVSQPEFTINRKNNSVSLDKFERNVQREEIRYESKQARKSGKNKELTPPQDPAEVAPTPPVSENPDARSYAERYVALYEKNSGRTLSAEERSAKVSQVAEFYSAPSRVDRLETLVDELSSATQVSSA